MAWKTRQTEDAFYGNVEHGAGRRYSSWGFTVERILRGPLSNLFFFRFASLVMQWLRKNVGNDSCFTLCLHKLRQIWEEFHGSLIMRILSGWVASTNIFRHLALRYGPRLYKWELKRAWFWRPTKYMLEQWGSGCLTSDITTAATSTQAEPVDAVDRVAAGHFLYTVNSPDVFGTQKYAVVRSRTHGLWAPPAPLGQLP